MGENCRESIQWNVWENWKSKKHSNLIIPCKIQQHIEKRWNSENKETENFERDQGGISVAWVKESLGVHQLNSWLARWEKNLKKGILSSFC